MKYLLIFTFISFIFCFISGEIELYCHNKALIEIYKVLKKNNLLKDSVL